MQKKQKKTFANAVTLPESQREDLLNAITPMIKNTLKSPLSAVFCSPMELTIYQGDDKNFVIKGFVNSQNSYGALIKIDFKAIAKQINGKWEAVSSMVDSKLSSMLGLSLIIGIVSTAVLFVFFYLLIGM